MSAAENGGPAFPEVLAVTPMGDTYSGHAGMTLRDHFAGIALQGELASQHPAFEEDEQNYTSDPDDMESLAVWCYKMADAMLAARLK